MKKAKNRIGEEIKVGKTYIFASVFGAQTYKVVRIIDKDCVVVDYCCGFTKTLWACNCLFEATSNEEKT